MALNDHPYAKFKLTKTVTTPEMVDGELVNVESTETREYAKVTIDNDVVWRKPIFYSLSLLFVDPDDYTHTIETESGAINKFKFYRKKSNRFLPLDLVHDNIDARSLYLDNFDDAVLIRYEDDIYYDYGLVTGYTVAQDNSTMMNSVSLSGGIANQFKPYGDLQIDIKYTAIKYSVTINADQGVNTCTVTRTPGNIAMRLGIIHRTVINPSTDPVFYGDTIVIEYTSATGYTAVTAQNSGNISVTGNIVYNITTEVRNYKVKITVNSGVQSLAVNRVYRRLPEESSDIVALYNGSNINYGDDVSVLATAETGYVMDSYTQLYTDVRHPLTISPTAHSMYGTLAINSGTGVASYSVTLLRRHGQTVGDPIYNGDTIYYGDVLGITATAEPGRYITSSSTATVAISQDGETFTVNITSDFKEYTLNIAPDNTSIASYSVTLLRRHGQTVGDPIYNGDTIYYGDVLGISYSSNTNYVVGSGYSTTESETVECTTFDVNDQFTYNISGTYTDVITIEQYAISNQELDSEDKITLKLRYGSTSATPENYDSTRRVRVDETVYLYKSDQTYIDNLPSINSVVTGSSISNAISVQEVSSAYSLTASNTYYLKFNPKAVTVKLWISSDEISSIFPPEANVYINLYSSSYKGSNIGTSTYRLRDSDDEIGTVELDLTFYYKDVIKINYDNVTGWTFDYLQVNPASGSSYNPQLNDPITIVGNSNFYYNIIIHRNINHYTITAENSYSTFTSIEINGVEKLPNTWTAYALERKYFQVVYGDLFTKHSELINSNNDPMYLIKNTHDNNTVYAVQGDVTVACWYDQRLCSPYIDTYIDYEDPITYADIREGWAGRSYEIVYEFTLYANNNNYGSPYSAKVSTSLRVGNTTYTDLNNETVNAFTSGNRFNTTGRNLEIASIPSDHKAYLTIDIYLEGKIIDGFYRNPSQHYIKEIELNIY